MDKKSAPSFTQDICPVGGLLVHHYNLLFDIKYIIANLLFDIKCIIKTGCRFLIRIRNLIRFTEIARNTLGGLKSADGTNVPCEKEVESNLVRHSLGRLKSADGTNVPCENVCVGAGYETEGDT